MKRASTRKKKENGGGSGGNTPNLSADRIEQQQRSQEILTMDEQHKTGHIDVWWLYDDGGMITCFVSYVIGFYRNCSLSIGFQSGSNYFKDL